MSRKALIVANDTYEHEGFRRLLAPAADASALAGVLGDPNIGDFDVRVVSNEPAYVIQERIEDLFADSRPDDVLLLHFSCHGLKGESGELFFATTNTRPNRLGSTAVSADFVQRCMRASRSRSVVLLLDCCYGGAFSRGVRVRAAGDVDVLDNFPGGSRGRAVITASSAMEYAFEGDRLADDHSRPSVFTSALVEGLATGEADRDQDGWVSLNELYDYVFDRVRERTPHQTPSRDIEMQGELYVARSRRPIPEVRPPAAAPAEHPEPGRPRRRRWMYAAGVAVLAAAAVVTTLLLTDGEDPASNAPDGPLPADNFEAAAPWRLLIRDNIQGNDAGCTVTMVHNDSGQPIVLPTAIYGPMSFQIQRGGTFNWSVNDPGCLTTLQSGTGSVALPFVQTTLGDTDAFAVTGPVSIEVIDFHGNNSCDFTLRDAGNGRQLDFGTVAQGGGPLMLRPGGSAKAYVWNQYCTARISAA
ncbi:caspase family protein [Paractinoplanes atraurantiacus]|uniref:Caspase domain-containing protein n=1 Tax=Paractinoplanes atraurantiacus TaxID=1036182 RepID=A0A285ITJ2_9ACTN|nr:caspase family protein [Actinoplanes atraurantiacus]SNY50261.1 Caspase domain-containing protein [Actinoplanes atraurantiacus]